MKRVVLRVRPAEVMDDLDLDLVRRRLAGLAPWRAELRDTRLSDATYLTVVATIDAIDATAADALQRGLSDLPRMRVLVWRGPGAETPLALADAAALNDAAEEVRQRIGDPVHEVPRAMAEDDVTTKGRDE